MRFDWYAATIGEKPAAVIAGGREGFEGDVTAVRSRPMHGYAEAVELREGDVVRARVLFGGENGFPHAWASGEDTDAFVDAVRGRWPDKHVVTRVDAAEDFAQASASDELAAVCLAHADKRRVSVYHAGDWHRGVDGRSIYFGSRKSDAFTRLYEKGKQMRALSAVAPGGGEISEHWVRLEGVVRPKKDARQTAAKASPLELWGYSAWMQALAQVVFASDVPRVCMQVWRPGDDERAFRFMCRQYGPMLQRLAGDLGDWTCVGLTIGDTIKELAERERRARRRG